MNLNNMTALCGVLLASVALVTSDAAAPYGVLPTAAHLDYQKREIIAIVHWGLNTFTGQNWGFGNTKPDVITVDEIDPEQWVVAMKNAAVQAVVLVCKHHDGFCLWPSKHNRGYSMSTVPGKIRGFDLVGATARACGKHGLGFGVYLSPWDRHQANYGTSEYVDYFHAQCEELLTGYGPICELWLDGANGGTGWYGGVNGDKGERRLIPPGDYYQRARLINRLHELHPTAVVFEGDYDWSAIWCGNEKGYSPETWWNVRRSLTDGKNYWMPSETDVPLRTEWFFRAHEKPKSLGKLVEIYFDSVGHGAILNLGIAPDTRGRVCEEDVARLKEFGDFVRAFNAVDFASVAGARETVARAGNRCVVTVRLPKAATFNCADFAERVELGQRVKSFTVEVEKGGVWTKVASGTTVGLRRLARFEDVTSAGVRITLEGLTEPLMKKVALRRAGRIACAEDARSDVRPKNGWKVVESGGNRLVVDCGGRFMMHGFDYVPSKHGCDLNDAYTFEISDDGKNWTLAAAGEIGNLKANPVRNRIGFYPGVRGRYFRYTATHSLLGRGGKCCLDEIEVW